MKYAEVSVNSPIAQRRTFSYAIPTGLDVGVGQAVLVPFGEKVLQGVVLEINPVPAVEDTREILDILEPEPILSPNQIQLARWISEYYLATLFSAVALMLPPAFERKALTLISPAAPDIDIDSLDNEYKKVMTLAMGKGRVELKQVEKALGKKKAAAVVLQMVRQGLIERSYELAPVRIKPKTELYISLTEETADSSKLSPKQAALYDFLKKQTGPVLWSAARKETGCVKSVANALEHRGLVKFEKVEVRREPVSYENIAPSTPLKLSADQQTAFDAVKSELNKAGGGDTPPRVFLLHGVTGSGKTEIYLQSLAEALKKGKKGIVLVPEISLTPQTIERFAARFPGRVGVLHSRLSTGEQFDEWRRIKNGECDVVIGSRSALFAPQPNLGLIIIDEEHEWTYKQDNVPHYHARNAAIKLAELTGAVVVLGSATPDVETYYKAKNGEFKLLELPQRVVPSVGVALPQVEVVDMREELKAGNRNIFSRSLAESVNRAVTADEQVILFLNRRGGSYYIQCRRCGFVLRCRRCDVPLAHHISEDVLTCHQCNYRTPVPQACPNCGNRQLKFLGAGTQKLEQEVKYTFPRARQLRWDSDAATGRTSDEDILRKFRGRQAEILIGTQMVAKGLDIPSVTLVGVVNADTSLNLPDFRAGERTFQLLSQVAGRAGRGEAGGKVIVQTFSPQHYAIKAAAKHDYASFYEQEIEYRKQLHNPPFTQLARLNFIHTNDAVCQRKTEEMKRTLIEESRAGGIGGISIIGPAPAFIHRLRGRYRWQLILRGQNLTALLSQVTFGQGWAVDVDPVSLIQ
ncbi:MAG: primosomal protein N' [Dehalococcoidales bacterium]|nr:primosomal protein N' [Dehalococcoidales bacterium]